MRKIPSLFQREDAPRGRQSLVVDRVTPGCEWVLAGEGVATVKFDGTAVLVRDGVLYARFDAKRGKPAPAGAIPCQEADPVTGHHPHWVRADRPEDRWIREAAANSPWLAHVAGETTAEACGPKINSNAEGLDSHVLWEHGCEIEPEAPRTFEALSRYLSDGRMEGLVWHHPDGRMAKIKTRDFGHAWPSKRSPS